MRFKKEIVEDDGLKARGGTPAPMQSLSPFMCNDAASGLNHNAVKAPRKAPQSLYKIYEYPELNDYKFIEFYDVRAVEAALWALNRIDIARKHIRHEPGHPRFAKCCSAGCTRKKRQEGLLCSLISSVFMGCCFSAKVKAESPPHKGLNSKVGGREDDLSGLSSKTSSSYVLLTSWTEGQILQSNNLKSFIFNEMALPFFVLHGETNKGTDPEVSRALYEQPYSQGKILKLYPGVWHGLTYMRTS